MSLCMLNLHLPTVEDGKKGNKACQLQQILNLCNLNLHIADVEMHKKTGVRNCENEFVQVDLALTNYWSKQGKEQVCQLLERLNLCNLDLHLQPIEAGKKRSQRVSYSKY